MAIDGEGFAALLKRIALMLVGICAGAGFGAGILTGADASRARTALGVTLIVYALFGLSRIEFRLSSRLERWLAIPVGLATGAMSAATGVFVIPSGPYLQAIGLEKDELVQALGMTYTVATVALGVTLAKGGFVQSSLLGPSALRAGRGFDRNGARPAPALAHEGVDVPHDLLRRPAVARRRTGVSRHSVR